MDKITIVFLICFLILLVLIYKFKIKNKTADKELKTAKEKLLVETIILRKKLEDSEDSVIKNMLSIAELGGNVAGCIYGYCGGGSATIGLITKRIK